MNKKTCRQCGSFQGDIGGNERDGYFHTSQGRCIAALSHDLAEAFAEIDRLRYYEKAVRRMAAQIVCPRTSAEEMVKKILGSEATT